MYTITDIKFSPALILCLHRQVSFACVRQDRHHALAFAQAFRDFERRDYVRPGRDADEQAFLPAQPARHLDGIVIADGHNLIVDFAVQDVRYKARPDALDSVHPGAPTLEHRRASGLDGHDQKSRDSLAGDFAHTGNRAAGPHAEDERVELAVRRFQYLERRRLAVYLRVGRVLELLRHEVVRVARQQLLRGEDGAGHSLNRRRQHDFRTIASEQIAASQAHVLRHRHDQPVALYRCDHRQPDAGVPARRLDDRVAGLQAALAFGWLDHVEGDPVFHAARRVHRLDLRHNLRRTGGDDAGDPHHRRAAHWVEHCISNLLICTHAVLLYHVPGAGRLEGAVPLRQVADGCLIEHADDCVSNISPHLALRAATVTSARAAIIKAIGRHDRAFKRFDHLGHPQGARLANKRVAPLRATDAANEAGAPQDSQQLLEVRLRNFLARCNLAALHGTRLSEMMRQFDKSAESVVAFGRDSHSSFKSTFSINNIAYR